MVTSVRARVLAAAVLLWRLWEARTLRAEPSTEPPPPSRAPAEEAPVEVVVRGTKSSQSEMGSDAKPARNLRDVPGTFGDPFQAVAALPGVAPMASGLPYFYVRGAPPADTGYYLDGIPLPTLFHIGPGPSVVPPALLERVAFFPSTAPARYGRFVGGIIAGQTAEPSPVARGEASLRLFDASAFVETPLDAASTALVAGRYGYPNVLLSIFAPNLSLSYGDYTVRLTRKIDDANSISVFALGSYDDERDASQNLFPVHTVFHRLDLRYDHRWKDGSLRIATTLGYDRTSTPLSSTADEAVTEIGTRLRIELKQRLGAATRISAGADANSLLDSFGNTDLHPDAQQIAGAYLDLQYEPTRRVELLAGVRVDAYRSLVGAPAQEAVASAVDPKFSVRIGVAPFVTWVSTLGVAHQPPTALLPVPGLRLDATGGLQTAYQYAEGLEVRLPWAMRASLTGFYTADQKMNDFVSDCRTFSINCNVVARVDGHSEGLELLVERAFSKRLAGWLAYTLSHAVRRVGDVTLLSPFDRTHSVSAIVRYDFGSGIEVGLRGTYLTGRPGIPSFNSDLRDSPIVFAPAALPEHRLPDFYRLDFRAQKRWPIGDRGWIAGVVEFFNATLQEEALNYRCDIVQWYCTAQRVGPITLPSIGVEGGF
jgi:hypothetical protein